jgi:hypothetical protein
MVTATLAEDNNYTGATSESYSFSINKAPSTITVIGSTSFTYNATPQGPASCSTPSAGTVTYYYMGSYNTTFGSNTNTNKPTVVGSYTVTAVLDSSNYIRATSKPYPFSILKVTPSISTPPTAVQSPTVKPWQPAR